MQFGKENLFGQMRRVLNHMSLSLTMWILSTMTVAADQDGKPADKLYERPAYRLYVYSFSGSGRADVFSLEDDVFIGDARIANPKRYGLYDRYTGKPSKNPDWRPVRRLTPEVLQALREWRNSFGRPWSTAVYEKPYTIETIHNHSIRLAIGTELATPELHDALYREIIDAQNIVWKESKLADVNQLESLRVEPPDWLRRNMSEYPFRLGGYSNAIAECFAWYTSPSYIKRSLPARIEELMELMVRAEHPGFDKMLNEDKEVLDNLRERLPSLLRSLERARHLPDPEKPMLKSPILGHNTENFLFVMQLRGKTLLDSYSWDMLENADK